MPPLIEFGPFSLQFFGLMVALGFGAGLALVWREAPYQGIDRDKIIPFGVGALISGIIGARIAYILFYNLPYYLAHPLEMLAISQGGLSIHGAVLGGILYTLWFAHKEKVNFLHLGDLLAPGVILGTAIGRVGCDVFGLKISKPFFWGVNIGGSLLHPVQVYEFLLDYFLFALLWILWRKRKFHGQITFLYLGGYALIRGVVEFFRENPKVWGIFSISHLLSLLLLLGAILGYYLLRKKKDLQRDYPDYSWKGKALVTIFMASLSLVIYYSYHLYFH